MTHLTDEQNAFFEREGYLVVEDVVDEATLSAIHDEYGAILDREAPRLAAEGKITSRYEGESFETRYPKILGQLDEMYDLYQHLDIQLPLLHRMEPDATLNTGPAIFALLRHPGILDIAESIIGPELDCNPVQHTRIKPPKNALPVATDSNVAKTYWHQDEAVLNDECAGINVLTVWVAITDATLDNGCMICVPGSHRNAEAVDGDSCALHCPGSTFSSAEIFIPDEIAGTNVMPMPVRRGGVVLLHQKTIHGSLENNTDSIRWSFDLRYNVRGQNTGREVFPKFLARSRTTPEQELRDPAIYARQWMEARDLLASKGDIAFNERWKRFSDHPLCA